MRDARHPTSPFSAQRMQQSSDATIEVAERHGSTAAAEESSLRLHPKMNQKNTPGHSEIKASEAPGRLPGRSRAPPKQGIKTDPAPNRKYFFRAPHLCWFMLKMRSKIGVPKLNKTMLKMGSFFDGVLVEFLLNSGAHFGGIIQHK